MTDKQPQPQGDAQQLHPLEQINWRAASYERMGGHGLIVQMLRSYAFAQAAIAARDAEIERLKKEARQYWAAAQEEANEVDRLRSQPAPEAAQPADKPGRFWQGKAWRRRRKQNSTRCGIRRQMRPCLLCRRLRRSLCRLERRPAPKHRCRR